MKSSLQDELFFRVRWLSDLCTDVYCFPCEAGAFCPSAAERACCEDGFCQFPFYDAAFIRSFDEVAGGTYDDSLRWQIKWLAGLLDKAEVECYVSLISNKLDCDGLLAEHYLAGKTWEEVSLIAARRALSNDC